MYSLVVEEIAQGGGNQGVEEAGDEERGFVSLRREGIGEEKKKDGGEEVAVGAHDPGVAAETGHTAEDGCHAVGEAAADAKEEARQRERGKF